MLISRSLLAAVSASLVICFSGCVIDLNTFSYTGIERAKSLKGEIPAGVSLIQVDNQYGAVLLVQADENSDSQSGWQWQGKIWSETEEMASLFHDELVLEQTNTGGVLTLKLVRPDSHSDLNGILSDITVNVPSGVQVKSENAHGNTSIVGLSEQVTTKNDHGNTFVAGMLADCKIENSHGDLVGQNVQSIEAELAHGKIKLSNAIGTTKLSCSHATVNLENVQNVILDGRHTDLYIRNATGNVRANTTHDDIDLINVTGNLNLSVQHGDIDGAGFNGDVKASAQHGDIKISSLAGIVELDSQHGDIELQVLNVDVESIDAESAHGDIVVRLPADAKVKYELDGNDCFSEFNDNSGGSKVRLDASHGDACLLIADPNSEK